LVEQYLVFAAGQALKRIPMHMQDWIKKLDGFLQLNDHNILTHAGKVSHDLASEHANKEYEKFYKEENRLDAPDFDQEIVKVLEKSKRCSDE